jgi:pyruvate/2-oxoglutarate dehydrogenase complex dihydrolipoamide dehydrogenase (E3) component
VAAPSGAIVFDAAVIGSGQAGPSLAVALAQRGEKVALVEGALLGGSCVNWGCTPTKTLRKSARVAHLARHATQFGIRTGSVEVDFAAAMQRMQQVVDHARAELARWIAGEAGVSLLRGWGAFTGRAQDGAFDLLAGEQRLRARKVYLNTGTRAFLPSIPGLDAVPALDNVSLLQLRDRPAHLLILGGSYIGLEMGQIFRRLGSQVTVIETAPRIIAREDPDVSAAVAAMLQDEGLQVLAGRAVERVERTATGVAVLLPGQRIEGSHLLVATGRLPNTERLELASVGVKTDERGFVPTDGALQTDVPGIWALGDINKRGAFTHTSYQDFQIVLANLAGGSRTADGRVASYAMYTDPPLGRVGMSEAEARQAGRAMLVVNWPMARVARAREEGETAGLIKLLVDAGSERICGATVLGLNGDEVIQVISAFMATGASYRVLQEALPIHPTVSEFLPFLLGKLEALQ